MKGGRLKRWINLGGALGAPLGLDEGRAQGGRAPARGEVPVAKDVRPMALCTPFKTGLENLTEILLVDPSVLEEAARRFISAKKPPGGWGRGAKKKLTQSKDD